MFFPGRGMPGMGPGQFMGTQMPAQAMSRAGGGGFLSKLMSGFKGGGSAAPTGMMQGMNPANFMQGPGNFMGAGVNAANAANAATGAAKTTSVLSGLTNPANLGTMLGNVQKALHTAESVMPMVQQYGPLVKNIPSMLKLYRELNSSDSDDDSEKTSDEEEVVTTKKRKTKKAQPSTESAEELDEERDVPKAATPSKKTTTTKSGQSVPRMYI
ncbi:VrrA/YqfQ family protein [Litchfieldia salsa]|uniref:YqfQ-like protein n=1 Tax=Litchfieldia salsa TaxID=930152 RepID=A0A1H0VAM0_9BACI|nr:VrrA/YqfQ family protein [Litchfieldia salsa]SDP75477.1 YqfQ-like protein [Litchfieldia salsa]